MDHRHDGLFLRVAVGPALTQYRASESHESHNASFITAEFLIGATVTENLSMHFGVVASADNGRVSRSVDSRSIRESSKGPTVDLPEPIIPHLGEVVNREEVDRVDVMLFGPGVTYHAPGNFYLSATVGEAVLAYTVASSPDKVEQILATEHGFGGSLSFGKEWWVSSNWGVGVALQGMYVISDARSFLAGGPVLSATFN